MKLKLTLQRSSGPVDLLVTVDATATVADLAGHLAAADPARRGRTPEADLTLRTTPPGGGAQLALDGRTLVGESGLGSGGTVSISQASAGYVDPQRPAAAEVRIIEGPDAGKQFALAPGSSIIGRERGCEVRLTDPLVSRRHARINVGETIEVVDLGSANGVLLDDDAVPRSVLRTNDVIQVGDTCISVRLLLRPAPTREHAAGSGSIGFVRPPRLDPVFEGANLIAPEPPERPRIQRFPLAALLAPVLMGGLIYLITKSLTSLVFVALSPLLLIGNAVESRLAGRSAYRQALKEWREDLASLVTELGASAERERVVRALENPATVDCLASVAAASPLLWTRRPGERGFAQLRLGTGILPSRTAVEMPRTARAARALLTELDAAVAPYATVGPVPVIGDLTTSAVGVGGPRSVTLPVARALVAQLVTLHSPADLVLAAVASTHTAHDWEWLKWLPHTSSPGTPLAARHLAASTTACTTLVAELEELVGTRQEHDDDAGRGPAIVLLVESDSGAEHNRLVGLAEEGAAVGVHVIWLADELAQLPAACKTYLELGRAATVGTAGYVHTASAVTPVELETLEAAEATQLARRMTPIVDLGARVDDDSDLPRSVSLLSIRDNDIELSRDPAAVIERWSENQSVLSGPFAPEQLPKRAGNLRAVVGMAAGDYHALDLRADGPHALVGGTTGAGKSELLQTWILAMAAAHSPQRLTFLLIDYKGGAAFDDCKELPHTVGMVTDLSPHLVRRALTSLAAEVRKRERLLHQHKAKDLVELEKLGVRGAPPSLVIVVDEFAALVSEVPEFVDGVVNIAQRGRSLGLHLILATQRPAGVIKDNLRANTNLRLALRMADEGDSVDVLGSPQAAFFDPAVPGRAVSKTGPGRLVPFQSGFAGGWTTDEPAPPDIEVEELGFGVGASWALPDDGAPTVDPGPIDIARLVATIRQASRVAELPSPDIPWLPELRHVYDLAEQEDVPSRRVDTELVFGLRDDPDQQTQPTIAFHPDRDGNLAVYGTGGSGKSTLLRTVAIAAGFTVRGGPCHVYGLDFGARGLSMLEPLPHVGSIIDGSDHERVSRLLARLRATIDERARRYNDPAVAAGTITDYRTNSGGTDEPRILLLVDGIFAFRQQYEVGDRSKWFDMLVSIATDGRQVGVHVLLSADRPAAVPATLASAIQRRVVLRMAETNDYGMLGEPDDVLTAASPPGRGLLAGNEIQVAMLCRPETDPATGEARLLTDVASQTARVRVFADSMRRANASSAPAVERLSDRLRLAALPAWSGSVPTLGMSGESLAPTGVDPRGSFIVSGPPGSGRTTALHSLMAALARTHAELGRYYFGNRRSALAGRLDWTGRALGAEDAERLAADLTGRIPSLPRGVIVVENTSDFLGSSADTPMQELARAALAEDWFVVFEGETTTLSGSYGLVSYAKSGRRGLALQPETQDGINVFRTAFPPRLNRQDFPPGRAFFVSSGRTELVQVAMPGDS